MTTFKITDSRRDKNCAFVTFSDAIVNPKEKSGGLFIFPAFSSPEGSTTSVKFAKFTVPEVREALLKKGFVEAV